MAMNRTIVIGGLKMHDIVLDIDSDGEIDGLCKFIGIVGDVMNIFITKLLQHGLRCKINGMDAIGYYDKSTQKYNGLLGELQNGHLDIVAMPIYYPLVDPGDNFSYTPPLYGDTMYLFGGYNITNESHEGNIFSMFTTVPFELWIGYFISFSIFVMMTQISTRVIKNYEYADTYWTFASAFLQQSNFPDSKYISILIVNFFANIGIFFMMTYAENSMGTDLVTIDTPIVVTCYDDILKRKINVGFSKMLPEYEKFATAPYGSKERSLFNLAVPFSLTPQAAADYKDQYLRQQVILVGRRAVTDIASRLVLGFEGYPEEGRAFVASDVSAKKFTNVFAYSSNHMGTPLGNLGNKVVQLINERGFYHYLMENLATTVAGIFHGPAGTAPSLGEKISSKIEVGSGVVLDIGWRHFNPVLILLCIGLILGTLALLAEKWHFKKVQTEEMEIIPNTNPVVRRRRKFRPKDKIGHVQIKFHSSSLPSPKN